MAGASLERRGDIAVITIDNPPVNAMSVGVPGAVVRELARAAADPAVTAIVLCGGGSGSIAGADIRMFGKPWPAGEPTLRDAIKAIEASPKPVVAALAGHCLGGGHELAISCHYRVAARDTAVGQPEVKLGFPPGAGGTQRLPRLCGVPAALTLCVEGNPVKAAEALELGLLDAVADGDPVAAAIDLACQKVAAGGPHRLARDREIPAFDRAIFEATRDRLAKRPHGQRAALDCVACVELATEGLPFDEGLKRERAIFEAAMGSDESRALRHVFFAERAVARVPGIGKDTPVGEVRSAGVVGSGTMGSGIAMCFANAGIPVTLIDASRPALDRSLGNIRKIWAASAAKGSLKPADVDQRMALITPAADLGALGEADLVIEAVFEEMPIKETVFRGLDAVAKPGAILASNTSYLDVDHLADLLPGRRGRVLGMHFFSPANVMRLLEVVRTRSASPETLATVLSLARRLRKIAVVAGVCHGFIGNRMLAGYIREAGFLLEEGCTPSEVDKAITDFGLPMGPFAVKDLAGLDIGYRNRKAFAHLRDTAKRYTPVDDRLNEMGRLGQKTGAGYYRYEAGSRTPIADPVVDELIVRAAAEQGIQRRKVSAEEIVERCLYPLVNEGARVLAEGIALRASDIDIVWINGYGFPAWRGGPMFWADGVGLAKVLASIERFHAAHDYWEPAPLLVELGRAGGRFADLDAKEDRNA